METSRRIKLIKERFGLTNADLAREAGVSRQAVTGWVKHGTMPSQAALINIRTKLGVSDSYVLGDSEEMLASDMPAIKAQLIKEIDGIGEAEAEYLLRKLRSLRE